MFEIVRRLRAPFIAVCVLLVWAVPASAVELAAVDRPAASFGGPAVSPTVSEAQSFTAAFGGAVTSLTVWVHRENEMPLGSDLRVELRAATLAGTPGDVLAIGVVPRSSVPVFNARPNAVKVSLQKAALLERGTRYFVALSATGAPPPIPTYFYTWEMTTARELELQNLGEFAFDRQLPNGAWTGGFCHCHSLGMDVRVDATDAQPPAVSFTTPTAGQQFEFGATPTADYACTDDLKLVSCTGSIADGAALARSVGEHSLSVTATDVAGKTTTDTRTYTVADTVAPAVTSSQEAAEFEVGQAVTTSFRCNDLAAVPTCAADRDTLDTASIGTKEYVVTATDAHGQTARHAVSYRVIDTVDPVVGSAQAGRTFELGAEVPTDVSCSDAAGIAACTADRPTLDTATVGTRSYTADATDKSGRNATTTIIYTVADRTAPSVVVRQDRTYELGEPGSAPADCDDLSEVAVCLADPVALDTATVGDRSYVVRTADVHSNERSATVRYSVADRTGPSIATPQDGETFEFGATVPTAVSCKDLSRVDVCTADREALDTDSVGPKTYRVDAADQYGNTSSKTVSYTVADRTGPSIATPQDGRTFELGDRVAADVTCNDLSEVVTCAPTPASLDTSSVGPKSYEVDATDEHGNASAKVVTYMVTDTTAPSISVSAPVAGSVHLLGADVHIAYACEDLSAVASCSGPAKLDTSTVGAKTLEVSAVDAHENTSTKTVSYRVVYDFAGWFAPVNAWPTVNVVKAGSTVPVKFSLAGDQGLAVLAAGAPTSTSLSCDALGTEVDTVETVTTNTGLTYDATSGRYQLNWKTKPEWAGQCRQFVLELAGGTKHRAAFRLR